MKNKKLKMTQKKNQIETKQIQTLWMKKKTIKMQQKMMKKKLI